MNTQPRDKKGWFMSKVVPFTNGSQSLFVINHKELIILELEKQVKKLKEINQFNLQTISLLKKNYRETQKLWIAFTSVAFILGTIFFMIISISK